MNLLEETIEKIKEAGLNIEDIIFIGSKDGRYRCTWEEFLVLANREYDEGYGSNEVASDLIILFKDNSRMYRGEYDGSEWWDVIRPLQIPVESKPIATLFTPWGRELGTTDDD